MATHSFTVRGRVTRVTAVAGTLVGYGFATGRLVEQIPGPLTQSRRPTTLTFMAIRNLFTNENGNRYTTMSFNTNDDMNRFWVKAPTAMRLTIGNRTVDVAGPGNQYWLYPDTTAPYAPRDDLRGRHHQALNTALAGQRTGNMVTVNVTLDDQVVPGFFAPLHFPAFDLRRRND